MGANTSKKSFKQLEIERFANVCISWSNTIQEPPMPFGHIWTIENFEQKMEMKPGKELKSGVFSIEAKGTHSEWCLAMKPNGVDEDTEGNVVMNLQRCDDGAAPINAKVMFYIMQLPMIKLRFVKTVFKPFSKTDGKALEQFDEMEVLSHEDIYDENLIYESKLIVVCSVRIPGESFVISGTSK